MVEKPSYQALEQRVTELEAEVFSRRQADKHSRLDHSRLMGILESIPDGVYIVDQHFNIEYINPVIERDFGEIQGRKCYQYFHDRTEPCAWCKNEEVFAGKSVKWEWYSAKNHRHYELFDTPFKNADGSISKFEIFHDITSLKRAENALRENERYLSRILQTTADGFWVLDREGCILDVNSAYCEMSGYTREETIGLTISDLEALESTEETATRVNRVIAKGFETFETKHRRKDGSIWPVEISTTHLKEYDGRFVCFCRDLTERSNALQALTESEARYRLLVENQNDLVIKFDRDQKLLFATPSYCNTFNVKEEEILGRVFFPLIHEDDVETVKLSIASLNEPPHTTYHEERAKTKTGWRWFGWSLKGVPDRTGRIVEIIASGRDITGQKKAENALKDSQIFLQNLTDMAYSADVFGNVVWVNSAIENITGLSKTDVMGKPFKPLFMEADHDALMDVYKRTLNGESLENTLTFITGVTCEFTSLPRRDSEGKIVGTFGIARDITEKRSSQEALKESEERLKRAQRVAKIGSWEYDLKTEKVWGSEEAFRIYGIERKTPFLPLDEVETHILETERVNQVLVDLITRNEPYDMEFEIKPENQPGLTVIHSIAELICDTHGNPLKVLGVIQDVTEQKRMREELEQSEEKYRAIFENKGTASGIFGEDGIILECNTVFEELSGYDKLEIVHKMKWSDFVVREDLERLLSYDAKRSKKGASPPAQYECRITTKAGEIKTVIVNINVVGLYRIVTLMDITAGKQAEKEQGKLQAQLLQSQKMESIGTLAGGIAHDFNNLLSSILGYSELALLDIPPESPMKNNLEAVYSSGKKAQELVAQILSFSRKDEQVRSPIALHLVIEDALKLLHHAIPSTIQIQTETDAGCRMVGDPSRMNQVIMNLCTNAYQAMLETGGTLHISLSRTEMAGKAAELAGIPGGFYGKLVVADTGVGIPAKQLERIFEPYFTTKEKGKGTGLGLAVVHGIIKSHEGAIRVKSEVGKGTQFEIYLPLTWAENVETNQTARNIARGSERILLVDDQEDVLQVETEMLKRLGYDITGMTRAREALDHFAGHSDQYDLVITDMTMPDMTGDRLAEQLREIRSDMPIILATGFSELISREKAQSMGIDGFLTKPVQLSHMADMIRKVIDGKPE